ncbi:site-specific integrase [Elizabethkingia sp. JS20170427COW]|uniref:tyrosine-type recombinase/integrase n=1 Tax=Elizabethkingia sp. JS20170427COW TaxID=2583851 RepID=UPI0011103D9F|nr:site-specific integrase [Elizabethkingia sp. JS20170427COW]QCX52247.1 integrase [Elizabethkingia sp. JS20170427COW]
MDVKAYFIQLDQERCIAIELPIGHEMISDIKKISGRRWDAFRKIWIIPDTIRNRKYLGLPSFNEKKLSVETFQAINSFVDWLKSKRYSANTIKTYTECIYVFFGYFSQKHFSEIDNDDIIQFNNQYILEKKLSATYQNQFVNAIKLFYRTIDNRQLDLQLIHRPRPERKLPHVLSKGEVKQILEAHGNLKHRIMLSLIYACGLRRGELLSLRLKSIDSKRMVIRINQSKGNKDRIVPISTKILEMLRDYYKAYKPKFWLFEGQKPGQQYSAKSLQFVLKQALVKAKIDKPVTLHWLRHSYATHLLESGTDLRYIQELLGHNKIYTHVSTKSLQNIKSPFDDL